MTAKHFVCISTEKQNTSVAPLIPLGDEVELYANVQTLCGKQQINYLCFSPEQAKFYSEHGFQKFMCPKCMKHPDYALYMLSEI